MIFSKKTKDELAPAGGSATIIGAGVTFTGDMSSTADIRIDGTIKGNVTCTSRVLIGADGFVEGNVNCTQADVMGRIKGNVTAKDLLYLHGKAFLEGDIYAAKLQVEPPANFNGRCYMTAASEVPLIEMNNEKHESAITIGEQALQIT